MGSLATDHLNASQLDLHIFPSECAQTVTRVQLFATPWTVARQALSMGISGQEYWSGVPAPPPEDPSELVSISKITHGLIHSCAFKKIFQGLNF